MCYICDGEIYEDHFNSSEEYKFFYDEMKKGKVYSTTGLNPFHLKEYFEGLIDKYKKDIVHICLSSGLSGTCELTKQVANEINETSKHKVHVVDSLSATQGQNFILSYAIKLRDEGKTMEEILPILENATKRLRVHFFLSDLETLKRGGRISGAQAMMAKVIQLRPILRFNAKGELEVTEKIMGSKKAIRALIDIYARNHDQESPVPPFLTFAGDPANMVELRTLLEERFGVTNLITGPVGPVICSHTGPSLTGIIFLGKTEKK